MTRIHEQDEEIGIWLKDAGWALMRGINGRQRDFADDYDPRAVIRQHPTGVGYQVTLAPKASLQGAERVAFDGRAEAILRKYAGAGSVMHDGVLLLRKPQDLVDVVNAVRPEGEHAFTLLPKLESSRTSQAASVEANPLGEFATTDENIYALLQKAFDETGNGPEHHRGLKPLRIVRDGNAVRLQLAPTQDGHQTRLGERVLGRLEGQRRHRSSDTTGVDFATGYDALQAVRSISQPLVRQGRAA